MLFPLTIYSLTSKSTGFNGEEIGPLFYTCIPSITSSDCMPHNSFVHTAFEPPSIVSPPQPVMTAVAGGVQRNTTFNCTSFGSPTLRISWIHNMQNVNQNGRFQVMVTENDRNHTNSTLTINTLIATDSGIIRCVADNSLSVDSADTTLSVLSKCFLVTRIE